MREFLAVLTVLKVLCTNAVGEIHVTICAPLFLHCFEIYSSFSF